MADRRRLAAGNWKMNGTSADLVELDALADLSDPGCDVLICPPATLIGALVARANGRIHVGGQDCHVAASGAHTGDISAAMLRDAGATHVILGHSERRADHGETDAAVRAKAKAAQAAGLTTILCVGETLDQRDRGETMAVVTAQLDGSVPEDGDIAALVVAYEPVWAIGTGKVPSPDQIAEVHAGMRERLAQRFGAADAARIPLLYGGSVKADNAPAIFALPDVDGALVGGASLKASDFVPIVRALGAA